jgi:hypothetical protein
MTHHLEVADLMAEIASLTARCEAMEKALKIYGGHHEDCGIFEEPGQSCTCGLDAALQPASEVGQSSTMHSGTFLGYRDKDGKEMHCVNAFCPHEDKCRKGCANRVARPGEVGR